jgi:hypothetical protein
VSDMGRRQFLSRVAASTVAASVMGWPLDSAAQTGAPVIGAVSGQLVHGAGLQIGGSSFGTKAVAAPLCFDQMTTGAWDPSWGRAGSDWHIDYGSPFSIVTTLPRHTRNGSFSAYANMKWEMAASLATDSPGCSINGGVPTVFAQFWCRLGPNWAWPGSFSDSLANIKVFRMYNSSNNAHLNMELSTCIFSNEVGYAKYLSWNPETALTLNTWHCFQFAYQENSAVNARDGVFVFWFDGKEICRYTDVPFRTVNTNHLYPLIIGFYNAFSANGRSPSDFRMHDVYLDSSWARVELGDASVYSSCSHREIQRLTSWTGSSIGVNINLGSFPDNANLYLFVTNGAGQVSQGFQVQGGTEAPPRPPQGVTIKV